MTKGNKADKEPEKEDLAGRKGITVTFDEARFLRLEFLAINWIEDNAVPGRLLPIEAIMANITRVGILKVVLQAALGLVHNEPRVKASEIPNLVEAYIENTGDLEDLQQTLRDVYDLFRKNPMKLAAKMAEEKVAREKAIKGKREEVGGEK